MVPNFKDEESKTKYINSMLGILLGTEKMVKETKEKLQNAINSDNTDELINTLEFFGSCLLGYDNVSRKIMEDSQTADLYHPTYEERYDMIELLRQAYQETSSNTYTKGQLESRRPQKAQYVKKIADSIGMGTGEFNSLK